MKRSAIPVIVAFGLVAACNAYLGPQSSDDTSGTFSVDDACTRLADEVDERGCPCDLLNARSGEVVCSPEECPFGAEGKAQCWINNVVDVCDPTAAEDQRLEDCLEGSSSSAGSGGSDGSGCRTEPQSCTDDPGSCCSSNACVGSAGEATCVERCADDSECPSGCCFPVEDVFGGTARICAPSQACGGGTGGGFASDEP